MEDKHADSVKHMRKRDLFTCVKEAYLYSCAGQKAVNVEDLLRAKGEQVDNRLSDKGITGLKLATPIEGPDGTLEIRPEDP